MGVEFNSTVLLNRADPPCVADEKFERLYKFGCKQELLRHVQLNNGVPGKSACKPGRMYEKSVRIFAATGAAQLRTKNNDGNLAGATNADA